MGDGAHPGLSPTLTRGFLASVGDGAPVTWASRKQREVTLSSMESEFIALVQGVQDAKWLRNLLEELGVLDEEATLPVFVNNEALLPYVKNGTNSARTRHVNRLGVAYNSVARWIATERHVDQFKDLPRTGRPRLITQKMSKRLKSHVQKKPFTTPKRIRAALGWKMSGRTIKRALQDYGFVCRRPRKVVSAGQ